MPDNDNKPSPYELGLKDTSRLFIILLGISLFFFFLILSILFLKIRFKDYIVCTIDINRYVKNNIIYRQNYQRVKCHSD